MIFARRGLGGICMGLVLSLASTSAWATTVDILSISSDAVDTSYDHNTQVLSFFEESTVAEVRRADGSASILPDVLIDLNTMLVTDTSSGGVASGLFAGGTVTLTDNSAPEDLLLGDLLAMSAQEVEIAVGSFTFRHIIATGSFRVIGGSLAPDFNVAGDVVTITFELSANPEDFLTSSFTGLSKVTLIPTPEPASLAVLMLGLPMAFFKKIRKHR